jgi:energy-coupling factor transporter ATP-binding protein EcfA2
VPRQEAGALFAAIEALSADLTVLFIEHDMDIVFRFASRVIVMLGGRILVEGSPAEIAADPRVREVYLGGVSHANVRHGNDRHRNDRCRNDQHRNDRHGNDRHA